MDQLKQKFVDCLKQKISIIKNSTQTLQIKQTAIVKNYITLQVYKNNSLNCCKSCEQLQNIILTLNTQVHQIKLQINKVKTDVHPPLPTNGFQQILNKYEKHLIMEAQLKNLNKTVNLNIHVQQQRYEELNNQHLKLINSVKQKQELLLLRQKYSPFINKLLQNIAAHKKQIQDYKQLILLMHSK